MYTHEQFAADVVKRVEFLETTFGMRRHPAHVEGRVSWIAYENSKAKVIVEHELGASCTVSIQNLRHVKKDPLERGEFDLDEVVAASGKKLSRRDEPRNVPEAVAKSAELLQNLGAGVLNGEFAELQARQQKMADTIRKHQAAYDLTPLGEPDRGN